MTISLALVAGLVALPAQTLYVPGGTVGSSPTGNSNVGVGTATPRSVLDVNGTVSVTNELGLPSSGKGVELTFQTWSDRGRLISYDRTNSVYKTFNINDNVFVAGGMGGYVGIGVPNPLANLHALGGSNYIGTIIADGPLGGYSSFGLYENGSYKASIYWHPGVSGVGFYGSTKWFFESGNVGIGTISPEDRLHVMGRAIFEGGQSAIVHRNGLGSTVALTGVRNDVAGETNFTFYGYGANWIFHNGNVGIGTAAPTHKLSVNGAIRAKEVIVDTGWADHVFAEDYRLAPLSEVESQIKAERHLPGIPSAAEIAEHGVSIGEMQARMLAKIEELTLHVIALKKENDALKTRMLRLESATPP